MSRLWASLAGRAHAEGLWPTQHREATTKKYKGNQEDHERYHPTTCTDRRDQIGDRAGGMVGKGVWMGWVGEGVEQGGERMEWGRAEWKWACAR